MKLKLIIIGFSLLIANVADASLFRLDMNGTVIYRGIGVPASSGISNNNQANLSIVFEDNVTSIGSTVTNFANSIISFNGNFGGYAFSGDNGSIRLGNSNVTRNGVTGDSVSIDFRGTALNTAYGIDRNDFTSTDGSVGGEPLRNIELTVFNENTDFLNPGDSISDAMNALVSDLAILNANDPFASNVGLRIFFSDQAFGSFPVSATSTVDSATLTSISAIPVPATVWLFVSGLLGLIGFAKRSV